MSPEQGDDRILVRDLRVWAHVGVLEEERLLGQWFSISFAIAADLSATAASDDLTAGGFDYGLGIAALERHCRTLRCLTLEHAAEQLLEELEALYGAVGLWLEIRKINVPVPGFDGSVAVRRRRRWPLGDPACAGPAG